jgi:hypothetical protein
MKQKASVFDIYSDKETKGETMMLSKTILNQLSTYQRIKLFLEGIYGKSSIDQIVNNFQILIQPKKYVSLIKAAGYEDGIIKLDEAKILELESVSISKLPGKFIPMSGAASRMFGFLNEFLKTAEVNPKVETFIDGLRLDTAGPKFAFVKPLINVMQRDGLDLNYLIRFKNYQTIVEYVLEPKGLNYKNLPKGRGTATGC